MNELASIKYAAAAAAASRKTISVVAPPHTGSGLGLLGMTMLGAAALNLQYKNTRIPPPPHVYLHVLNFSSRVKVKEAYMLLYCSVFGGASSLKVQRGTCLGNYSCIVE